MIGLVPILSADISLRYEWNIERERTRLLSQPWFPKIWERVLRSWPCYELHARLLPSNKSEMRWQAADYIARRPFHFGRLHSHWLARVFILHRPITCSYKCMIEIGFSWRGKKSFSHTKRRYLDAVLVPISQGTKVTIVIEYVFLQAKKMFLHYQWKIITKRCYRLFIKTKE